VDQLPPDIPHVVGVRIGRLPQADRRDQGRVT
jgi:hypothetical protein